MIKKQYISPIIRLALEKVKLNLWGERAGKSSTQSQYVDLKIPPDEGRSGSAKFIMKKGVLA